jgi:predicted MFS family arabinose efflux permease
LSFIVLAWGGATLSGLIGGVLLLDLAVQAGHVANQTRIYAIDPSARGRLNAVYMTCYFIGGSTGSFLGGLAWRYAHWPGVCACGAGAMVLGLAAHIRAVRSRQGSRASA